MSGLLLSLLSAGFVPLVKLATGMVDKGERTITTVRAVQGLSIWSVLVTVLGDANLWVTVLPAIQSFVNEWGSETLVGSAMGLVLSIIFEVLRRVTTGPVRR